MSRRISACIVLWVALASMAEAQTPRPNDARVQAVVAAWPPYQAAAGQAMEKIKAAIGVTKDAKTLSALYNAQLRAEMILSVPAFAEKDPAHFTVSLETLKNWQEAVDYFLAAAREGRDGFEGMTSGVRALRSPIDGQMLFYKFRLPAGYSAAKKYPLEIGLHSGAGLVWRATWVDGKPSNDPRKAQQEQTIWISPCGRGNNSYAGPAQVALVQEIEDAMSAYAVDPDRVFSGGASMGGTGSFRIGSLHPHLLAGMESLTGGGAYGYGYKSRFDSYELVENFANVAVLIFDANNEGHYKDNHQFVENLKGLGQTHPGFYKVNEITDPKGSHGIIDKTLQPAGRQWLKEQKRNPWPSLVVYKLPTSATTGVYWVRIEMFEDPNTRARIEAERGPDQQIRVATENLARFELNLDPQLIGNAKSVAVAIDGQKTLSAPAGRVAFARTKDQWALTGQELPPGLLKRPGMSGPMMDVFMEHPVLFVHGAAREKEAGASQAAVDAAVLSLWGLSDGGSMLHTMFDRKADSAVNNQDIASSNLVLMGTPSTNVILQRIADKLPVKFGDGSIEVGGKTLKGELFMCYPNPLNPQRYVLILPTSWTRPAYGIYTWSDWMVLDGRNVTGQGNFDGRWKTP